MAYGLSNGHVTADVTWPWKVKLVIPIRLDHNILKTAGARDSVPKDHQQEMAYWVPNGHVTDDVTCSPKVLWASTVGYPSDSLASCVSISCQMIGWELRLSVLHQSRDWLWRLFLECCVEHSTHSQSRQCLCIPVVWTCLVCLCWSASLLLLSTAHSLPECCIFFLSSISSHISVIMCSFSFVFNFTLCIFSAFLLPLKKSHKWLCYRLLCATGDYNLLVAQPCHVCDFVCRSTKAANKTIQHSDTVTWSDVTWSLTQSALDAFAVLTCHLQTESCSSPIGRNCCLERIARTPFKSPLIWVPLNWMEIWAADFATQCFSWLILTWECRFCGLATIFMLSELKLAS